MKTHGKTKFNDDNIEITEILNKISSERCNALPRKELHSANFTIYLLYLTFNKYSKMCYNASSRCNIE